MSGTAGSPGGALADNVALFARALRATLLRVTEMIDMAAAPCPRDVRHMVAQVLRGGYRPSRLAAVGTR